MSRRSIALAVVSALAMGAAAAQERPDAFPSRSIKIVVPFPAGGPSDVLARMIGQKMSEDWAQPVVIENRVGANTVLGAQQVAKAAPDGYTLLMAIDSTLTMNQYLYRSPPYDPFNDFVPITLAAKTMVLLIVNAASDVKTVKELIAKAKAQPGKLNFGAGTITTKLASSGCWPNSIRARFRRCPMFRSSLRRCRSSTRSRSGSGWSRREARPPRSSTSSMPRWRGSWPIPPSSRRPTLPGCFRRPARRRNFPPSSAGKPSGGR